MDAKEFLKKVCQEIKYKPANKYISEEIEGHIQDIKNEYLCKGYTEKEAEEKAVKQMGDAKLIGKKLNKIHRPKLDWKILILIAILIGFKIIITNNNWLQTRSIKYIVIGLIIGVIIYFFDYRKTKRYANLIYFGATGILIFQWINWYFGIDFAISNNMFIFNMRLWNICIPLYIIAFAGYVADYEKEDFWDMIALYSISCILIYWQSESITNTLILVMSYLAIISSKMLQNKKSNVKKVIRIWIGTLTISLITMILMTNMNVPYLFCGNTSEYDYNVYVYERVQGYEQSILQNLKLIGNSGQLEELSQSNTSQFRFLYLLGTLGIIPGIIVVLTVLGMSIRLIKNAKKIEDVYGKYLIIGLSATYIIQSVIHVMMNLNLWIRSDVNLPFVAEGNLYFLINCITFAVILSVYRRKNINFDMVSTN